ncbi:MAG: helix-turn-helix domain-containing protein [Rhizobiaceae bacterium]|nr:helix-turn-helix domain-containing protein [Rhizobiaceae bacterium]
MIDAAAELFRARGYHGVGLAEILSESGAPKGSFYHHFPQGKDELALAVIENGGRFVSKFINEVFESARNAEDAVSRFTSGVAYAFKESGFSQGCPITSILLELTPKDEAVRSAANNAFETWIEKMVAHSLSLEQGKVSRQALDKAFRAFLIAIEGGWIVARATQTVAPIMMAHEIFASTLKMELGRR